MNAFLRSTATGTELTLHIQPGASQAEIIGLHGDALKIRISARAVEGAANAALLEFVAGVLGVTRREVRIVRGEKSRRKVLAVALPLQAVTEKLKYQKPSESGVKS